MVNNLPAPRYMFHYSQTDLACFIDLSRQTIDMIGSRKRTISWSLFLSQIFFNQSEETNLMLAPLKKYTSELKDLYRN